MEGGIDWGGDDLARVWLGDEGGFGCDELIDSVGSVVFSVCTGMRSVCDWLEGEPDELWWSTGGSVG